jgi:hypothetical protein
VKGWPGFRISADSNGFSMRSLLGRWRIEWNEIEGDLVVRERWVFMRLTPAARRRTIPRRILVLLNRPITGGFDAGIQASAYRMSPVALRDWLETSREHSAMPASATEKVESP